jgi:DNA-binding transcriptional regulator YiaG
MKKYRSEIARSVYEDAKAMFEVGAIDAKRMHEYDVNCLVPSAVPTREISYSSGDSRPTTPIPAVAAARA